MGGWIRVDRTLLDPQHELHPASTGEPACRAFAWVDLIGMARWAAGGGLQAGQVRVSERFLERRWNRPRSWVQRFLAELEANLRITRQPSTGRQPGRIMICHYAEYQDPQSASESTGRSTNRSTNRSKEEQEHEHEPKDPYGEDVRTVFERCRELRAKRMGKTSGPPLQLTAKRASRIRARLREGWSVEQLLECSEGFYADTWKDRDDFLDPAYAFKNDEAVRKFRRLHKNGSNGSKPPLGTRAAVEAMEEAGARGR